MNRRQTEDLQIIYYKLLDGLSLKSGGKVCESSFNNYITAKYLLDKNIYDTVYALTYDMSGVPENIIPLKVDMSVAQTMRRMRADTHISLGGTFMFQPIHDVVYALHGSLNVGGRLVLSSYPKVYDSQGRDVLAMLSDASQMPVRDKLTRWALTVSNSVHNLFMNIKTEELICDASVSEVQSLFGSETFNRYLFKNETEHEMFFEPLSEEQKYYMSWTIIRGLRI